MNDIFEKHFKEQGFTEPTLIQKEVYPLLAQGEITPEEFAQALTDAAQKN